MITLKGHPKSVWGLSFAPDGSQLASLDSDGLAILWDSVSGSEVERKTVRRAWFMPTLTFSPDGESIAVASGAALLWDLASGDVRTLGSGGSLSGARICYRPDGSMLAMAGHNWSVEVNEDADDVVRWTCPAMTGLPMWDRDMTSGGIAFSPDGQTLASAHITTSGTSPTYVYEIWLRDPDEGNVRAVLRGNTAPVTDLAFSPDGTKLASLAGITLRVWDVTSRELLAARKVGSKHFKGFAFTPDGRSLLTVNNDQTVRVWETDTWTETSAYEWKIGKATSIAIAPDGLRAAVGGGKGKIILFDLDG